MKYSSDTIAAISTPSGRNGIGIIRISGSRAMEIISKLVQSKNDLLTRTPGSSRKLIHGFLLDKDQSFIDEILIAIMPPERAYTGELTVELNCHGSMAVIAKALERVLDAGARLAEPGEFTRRAVENGRLDLAQAEAINDLINARSHSALKAARRQIEGGLSRKCNGLREALLNISAEIVHALDMDLDAEGLDFQNLRKKIINVMETIASMLRTVEYGSFLTQGFWVVLSGAPNVGKSSLFNALLNMDRALVCNEPGTTRDHISETIFLDGIEVRLTDTAGIRKSLDPLEEASIKMSLEQADSADLIIRILDQNQDLLPEQFIEAENAIAEGGLVVLNKSDLKSSETMRGFLDKQASQGVIQVSARDGSGIDRLKYAIRDKIKEKEPLMENPVLTNKRQIELLQEAGTHLLKAKNTDNLNLDIMSFELQKAIEKLEKLVGAVKSEEVLKSVFNNFCVGK